MRRIERTNAFRRDFKREKSGQHRRELEPMLTFAVSLLAEDKPLPEKNRDHALGGDWRDHRGVPPQSGFAVDLPSQAGRSSSAAGPSGLAQRTLWVTAITTPSRAFPLPGLK